MERKYLSLCRCLSQGESKRRAYHWICFWHSAANVYSALSSFTTSLNCAIPSCLRSRNKLLGWEKSTFLAHQVKHPELGQSTWISHLASGPPFRVSQREKSRFGGGANQTCFFFVRLPGKSAFVEPRLVCFTGRPIITYTRSLFTSVARPYRIVCQLRCAWIPPPRCSCLDVTTSVSDVDIPVASVIFHFWDNYRKTETKWGERGPVKEGPVLGLLAISEHILITILVVDICYSSSRSWLLPKSVVRVPPSSTYSSRSLMACGDYIFQQTAQSISAEDHIATQKKTEVHWFDFSAQIKLAVSNFGTHWKWIRQSSNCCALVIRRLHENFERNDIPYVCVCRPIYWRQSLSSRRDVRGTLQSIERTI